MKLINNNNITDPSVNLALEEFCVRNLDMNSDYLLFYINEPSLIIGKHQNTIEEINQTFVRENNIKVVRRISGGGTVYHDYGNLNFSFMTKHSQNSIHNFKLFTEPVIKVLHELGINAELNGRNDITVNERKISGNAQFTDTKSMFSHGTLLFDTNLESVSNALNVKQEKIESKGIKSVRSRVANIKEFFNLNFPEKKSDFKIEEFKNILINSVFSEYESVPVYNLSDEEWKKVFALSESKYKTWEWNFGRSPEFNIQKINRFTFGQIDARINVKDGLIQEIKFYGDFLGYGEMSDIENKLTGVKYEKSFLTDSLKSFDLNNYFGNININEFIAFLFE
ncbi:MAG: lipoate--protein ligase [Ignavibacteria bacterium]|nr:lipoate--protein ligase [Ignavibacteria bacterium]